MSPSVSHRDLLAANLKRISEGDQRGMHVSADHYAWLGNALAYSELETKTTQGALLAIIHAAGGTVEGHPIGPHNILQRIRQLTKIEAACDRCCPPD